VSAEKLEGAGQQQQHHHQSIGASESVLCATHRHAAAKASSSAATVVHTACGRSIAVHDSRLRLPPDGGDELNGAGLPTPPSAPNDAGALGCIVAGLAATGARYEPYEQPFEQPFEQPYEQPYEHATSCTSCELRKM